MPQQQTSNTSSRKNRGLIRPRAEEGPIEEFVKRVGMSGEYKDFTIRCGSRIWPVHKVLGPRSEYFKIAFDGEYRDKSEMKLDRVAPEIVDRMIKFVYTSDFDDEPQIKAEEELSAGANILINTRVFILAENYQIPALKIRVTEKLKIALATGWSTANFIRAIALTWQATHKSAAIRSSLLNRMITYRTELFRKPEFHALLRSDGNIAVDFMLAERAAPNKSQNVTALWCSSPQCQKEQHVRCVVCDKASNLSFIAQDAVPDLP